MSHLPLVEPSVGIACRTLLLLVFARGVIGKARDFAHFVGIVATYRVVPEWSVSVIAGAVFCAEVLVLGALATGILLPAAAVMGALLLDVFDAAIAINLARGRLDLDCGCGGSSGRHPIGPGLLVRNGMLALAFLPVAAASAAPILPLQWVSGMGAGVSGFVLCLIAEIAGQAQRRGAEIRARWS